MARLNYLELPVDAVAGSIGFYERALGWSFVRYGPDYAATNTGDVDLGLNGDPAERTAQALPVIQVDDLEATERAVRDAGGTITLAIFGFPGGRRFHFRDPAGHELAAMTPDG